MPKYLFERSATFRAFFHRGASCWPLLKAQVELLPRPGGKGKSCSLLASPYHFSIEMSHPRRESTQSTGIGSADISASMRGKTSYRCDDASLFRMAG
jgi:hypothetical protein